MGYKRYVAIRKPPISEKNRTLRLYFAYKYRHQTSNDWKAILWSDETWMTYRRHRKTYITRRPGEQLDSTCVVNRIQKKEGWMFWVCFAGYGKGPGIFWEKEQGSINTQSYCDHTVPIISGWMMINAFEQQPLVLMQDNAPSHAAEETVVEIQARGIKTIPWPLYSPDLDPIETCSNQMKDWVEDRYGDEPKPSYDMLRSQVKNAWEALSVTPR